MIRTILLGRTGNNLFQYAAARAQAERRGTEVWLDGSGFDDAGWRSISCLGRLPIKARLTRRHPVIGRITRKWWGRHPWELGRRPVWREDVSDLSFDPTFFDVPDGCVVRGYFQTWRYFSELEEALREELDLGALRWRSETLERAARLSDDRAVAVHVRRTDYLGNANVGFLGRDYYRRALARMRERVPEARFHFFSDDPAGAVDHLEDGVMVEQTCDDDPLHDLFLMSCARHHVIANSSYSWWAAWLGAKAGQVVLMPSEWSRGAMISPIGDKQWPGWECVEVGKS